MKKYPIIWSKDSIDSLDEIIDYIIEKNGISIAQKINQKIVDRIGALSTTPLQGKVAQELKEIGVLEIHELVETPWRIFYKIQNDKVLILSIIDGRRNVSELLISKVIDGKIV